MPEIKKEKKNIYINIGGVALVLLILVTIAYFLFNLRGASQGPQILIDTPPRGVVVNQPVVELEGKVSNVAEITINGAPIQVKNNDMIKERFVLQPGENQFDLEAKDRYGHSTNKTIKIIYKETE